MSETPLFHPRMIRPVVHRLGARASRPHPYLKQPPAPGGWKPVHSQAWVDFRFTSMHRMHRIFSGDGWLVFPDIRVASGQAFAFEPAFVEMEEQSHLKSAPDHCPSQRLLQQPPVLIILCILCIDVQFIVLLDGSAQSRGAGARLAGKREFPKGDRPAFREVARRIPSTSPSLVPETKPVSPSFDPHRRGGTGGRLNTCVAAAEPAQERYIMGAGLARKG